MWFGISCCIGRSIRDVWNGFNQQAGNNNVNRIEINIGGAAATTTSLFSN